MLFTISNKEVIVDNAHVDILGMTAKGVDSWCVNSRGYAQAWVDRKTQVLHRLVAAASGIDTSHEIDHINGNKLDNRVCNLRAATKQQNRHNRKKETKRLTSSQYKGVSWNKPARKWSAYVIVNSKQKHLGCFDSEQDAALAYDKAAIAHFGAFVKTNFHYN